MRPLLVIAGLAFLFSAAPANAAGLKACYDRGYEDLKAAHVSCHSAQQVYRASLNAAQRHTGSFRAVGHRWTCRASNPPAVPFYTWKCRAAGTRVVQYRWKSGD